MRLDEAKEILKNNGYLLEASRKQKGGEFFTAFEKALKDNFENVELIKKLKSNSKAKYSFDTKEYQCDLDLEFDYGEKGLDDEGGDIYAWLDFEDGYEFYEDFFGDDEIDKIIKWIKASSKKDKEKVIEIDEIERQKREEREKQEEMLKKKPVVKKTRVKKPKYTDLHVYKSDIYDALTARGLGDEFAMDYVAGLDYDFMKANQDINELADEAVREWG
jgi:hypothetical protein